VGLADGIGQRIAPFIGKTLTSEVKRVSAPKAFSLRPYSHDDLLYYHDGQHSFGIDDHSL
jgi:hypothetical protein